MEDRSGASAAILTGGRSLRMGTDKALLNVDGRSILDRTLATIEPVTQRVLIVGDRPEYHGRGARVVADRYPGAAALGGIATALETAECSHVLVVACDMPFLCRSVLRDMLRLPREYDVLVPVTVSQEPARRTATYHSLHAIYARTCLPIIREAIAAQDFKVSNVLARLHVVPLSEEWLRERDEELASLVNVNTRAELNDAIVRHGIRDDPSEVSG